MKIKESFLNAYAFFEKHYKLLLVAPATLGGLWQLIELSNIDTSYIRFFSVTQIIPDGLLVLFFFSLVFLSVKFAIWMIYPFDLKEENTKIKKQSIKELIFQIILLLFFLVGFLFILREAKFLTNLKSLSLHYVFVMIPVLVASIAFIMRYIRNIFSFFIIKFPFFFDRFFKRIFELIKKEQISVVFTYLFFGVILFTLFIFLSGISNFRNSYTFPENLNNIKEMKNNIQTKFPNSKTELLYMNDTYIFIELNKKQEKNIVILKFEEFFK